MDRPEPPGPTTEVWAARFPHRRARPERLNPAGDLIAGTSVDHLILCYHGVSSSWRSPLVVSESALGEQLSLLRRRGYEGLTFAQWERRAERDDLPPRSVVVTFDDGYSSTLRALPALDRVGFPATVFPVLEFVESGAALSWPGISQWSRGPHRSELAPLGWSQLEELAGAGWEVGSHTVRHPRLPALADTELETELGESRAAIASRLGRCETIAYPYGAADDRVAGAAARAGYLAGCTLSRFHLTDRPHLRPRIDLYSTDTGARLRLKLSRAASHARRSGVLARAVGD